MTYLAVLGVPGGKHTMEIRAYNLDDRTDEHPVRYKFDLEYNFIQKPGVLDVEEIC